MSKKKKNSFITLWSFISLVIVISIILFVFSFIFIKGFRVINLNFLTKRPSGFPPGSEGGIYPAIMGTLYLVLISGVVASILAISTSIYCRFYCTSKRYKAIISLCIQCIAGIPSIVLGLFGYSFLVLNLNLGKSLLSAGITLGIMIFPYIEIRIEKLFNEIPKDMIEASYSLGVSKSYTILKIVIPHSFRDIVSSITMACGFAMGATSPIILTGAVLSAPMPKSILSPFMALPSHLYMLLGEGISVENAYGTTLVLLAMVLVLNIISLVLTIGKRSEDINIEER
ncbi:phosphate ABC transporter membrane protein 2, PhoT family [Clostridium collagenovorans DSM 3089]|uniref:Phosphate transport system permease protein PstA n=1 Tax=Clostridium collagenovorans DSM 3089 TaxID=1121306 RepID=A0A1M5XW61_9CLOT|nr:phosphate ABC transporter permease PstA [Clostridium collagenovorans]SHI03758.1 phosphate ABC transporter membrane protein 2, PhoT family [Clostridium collagenovorans DSM 3089]